MSFLKECKTAKMWMLGLITLLMVVLAFTYLKCVITSEGYSTEYPLPYMSKKWNHVQASNVVYPGSASMDRVKQLEEQEKVMNKKLFRTSRSTNYAHMGIWPDSIAPPKYGNNSIQNIFTQPLKLYIPDYKTTCFTQSPLTVKSVLKRRPNQLPLSFN